MSTLTHEIGHVLSFEEDLRGEGRGVRRVMSSTIRARTRLA